jgi:hypothetical protein
MWEFVVPEDEAPVTEAGGNNDKHAEYRPQRMGLGCSREIIQEKISENARKSRLTKLLKRQDFEDGERGAATGATLKRNRFDDDSENELSKASLVKKKTNILKTKLPDPVSSTSELSKSQRKRMKQKIKAEQRKLTHG